METYRGNCHCGAVTFEFRTPQIVAAMRCDCSICRRKAIVMTVHTIAPECMEIIAADGALRTYRFGAQTARHHFCGICGAHPLVETRLNPGHFRVNLGCVDSLDALRLPASLYDGKSL